MFPKLSFELDPQSPSIRRESWSARSWLDMGRSYVPSGAFGVDEGLVNSGENGMTHTKPNTPSLTCRYSPMNRSTALGLASMPAIVGLAWHNQRRTEKAANLYEPSRPTLPGERREISTEWGSASYRFVEGAGTGPPLVFVHGWGKTGDSAWWPILDSCSSSLVVMDLPGHGNSRLEKTFSLELAAASLLEVISDSGVGRPLLVAHSMGGPVALTAIKAAGPHAFAGLVALATSAYWVTPRVKAMMALAPYVMEPRSPIVTRTKLHDVSRHPSRASQICWSYDCRPMLRLLRQGAAELRRFDASTWVDLEMPNSHWVISTDDRVLPPHHQHASARLFGARVHEINAGHSLVMDAPDLVVDILDEACSSITV